MSNHTSRKQHHVRGFAAAAWVAVASAALVSSALAGEPLQVVTTIPDLASLARHVGGEEVDTFSLVAGPEDAHFVEAKPSFVKRLSQADVFISVGMELEVGYEPVLIKNARNARITPGSPGNIVAGQAIAPLDVPREGTITRALGDVHAQGNPHFNVDPTEGLRVADLIRKRLSEIRPARADYFQQNYDRLHRTIGEKLVGAPLHQKYGGTKLALLFQRGKLSSFLEQQGDTAELAGWLGTMMRYHGRQIVDDHPIWPYFARTFGLVIAAHLEPKPGIPPTTSHLKTVIDLMRANRIQVVVQAPYYDPRHARVVAEATGAQIALLAHQAGAGAGTDDWIEMIDYNVRTIAAAFARAGGGPP